MIIFYLKIYKYYEYTSIKVLYKNFKIMMGKKNSNHKFN